MALKDIFKMTKTNRYTADGREELIKAQEAETEDRRYNIGEISEKTGLQKTANGWVKPKSNNAGSSITESGYADKKIYPNKEAIRITLEKLKNSVKEDKEDLNSVLRTKEQKNRIKERIARNENAIKYLTEKESAGAGRNLGTEQKKRGPGAIHTPGKGNVGMDKMKEAAEKGLKGQELKEFMTGSKSESKPDDKKNDSKLEKKESEFSAKDLPEVGQKITFNWKDKGITGIKGTVVGFKTINGKTYARVRGKDKSLSPTGEFNVNLQILKSDGPRLNTNKGKITGNIEQKNGIWEPIYGEPADSAPRTLTGDTRIRVRK